MMTEWPIREERCNGGGRAGGRKVVHVHFEMRKESINGGTILHGNFRLGILLFAKTQTPSSCIDILQPCSADFYILIQNQMSLEEQTSQ
jgi:acyl dehydratase